MATALRITPQTMGTNSDVYDSPIDFDDLEYLAARVSNLQECSIQDSQKRTPFVHDTSKDILNINSSATIQEPIKIEIQIQTIRKTTEPKLEALFGYRRLFKVYYKYAEYPAVYELCTLDPNWVQNFLYGDKTTKLTKLTFYTGRHDYPFTDSGTKVKTELVFDPDGKSIRIDGLYDVDSITQVNYMVNIDPTLFGQIQLNDAYVVFNDPRNYFNTSNSKRNTGYFPFYNQISTIYSINTTTKIIFINDLGGEYICHQKFNVGDYVILRQKDDPTKSETIKVLTSSCTNIGLPEIMSNKITYGETLSNTYAKYDYIYKNPLHGKTVDINLRVEDQEDINTYNVFRGVIRSPFIYSNGKATLKIDNILGEVLQNEMRIHATSTTPLQRCSTAGSLASSVSWTVQTGSGALATVTIYIGAQLGSWTVTFSDAANFTVTGPNTDAKAGSTAADFYDQTDATDSQIKIASASWSGTPATDDVLSFYVSANFSGKQVTEIIEELLVNYGGLASSWIDFSGDYADTFTMSFDRDYAVGEAIISTTIHTMSQIFQKVDNKIGYFKFKNPVSTGLSVSATRIFDKTFTYDQYDIYNAIKLYYAYDYENEVYQKNVFFPETDAANMSYQLYGKKRLLEIYLPAVYSDSNALKWAKRWYGTYAYGINRFKFSMDVDGIARIIGSTDALPFNPVDYQIIGITYDFNKKAKLDIEAIEYRSNWENFF